ncbi:MAG: diadenylate cyclase CdaA [Lentimicrobiaceae bacterium]|jgi:uncharacterized protein (TIGR00159 family)|nr:diadenylate cyclase CdaA [Lentimicrobiaceae bacterium]
MLHFFTTAFIQVRFFDVVDIILVAVLLYTLYRLLRGTAAINIFLGIIAIFLAWKLVTALRMKLLGDILGSFVSVGFIALIIIFQPEIRRFLLAVGTSGFIKKITHKLSFLRSQLSEKTIIDITIISNACLSMSNKKEGALIVICRENELFETIQTGVKIDAVISQSLIENIFFKNSPLHDGAMIISDNKIAAAGCILPITKQLNLPGRPGLRHRAGIGISEQSDALVIIVSEETGEISMASNGTLTQIQKTDLNQIIQNELGGNEEMTDRDLVSKN